MGKKFDLEERLIMFSVKIMEIAENLPNSKSGTYISGQIIRCGTAPALNYAEAQSAESRNDFIHKMKICLKELRETQVCLRIILAKPIVKNREIAENMVNECNELISIFSKSIETAKKNNDKKQ
jgi:four helix bundle protein